MEIKKTPIVELNSALLSEKQVRLFVKREDLNHNLISGNKAWKLKYNLIKAKKEGFDKVLTFGGAYSNHIYATSAAAKEEGLAAIGIIRGEKKLPLNDTLSFAKSQGIALHYMNRSDYRRKNSSEIIHKLREEHGEFYLIPEGGTNREAILGCIEMVKAIECSFDYYCSSVGTGGTLAGIIQGLVGKKKVLGFSSLKGAFLENEIKNLMESNSFPSYSNWQIINDYHFGGYAKFPDELKSWLMQFEDEFNIPLDPIYTSKALYGLLNMIEKDRFEKGSNILFFHTGGLQGRKGFNLD